MFTIDPDGGDLAARVVEVDLGIEPSPAGSGELLLHCDGPNAYLVLLVNDRNGQRLGPAIITFVGCRQSLFGYPNDEARWGNQRLRDHDYGIFEIHDSSWRAKLEAHNRKAFPNGAPGHDLAPFHGLSAMKAARSFSPATYEPRSGRDPFESAVAEVLRRMLD
jgi:hypothetical protein